MGYIKLGVFFRHLEINTRGKLACEKFPANMEENNGVMLLSMKYKHFIWSVKPVLDTGHA